MHAEGGDHPHPKVTVRALHTADNTWVMTERMGNVGQGIGLVDMLVVQSEDRSAEKGEIGERELAQKAKPRQS